MRSIQWKIPVLVLSLAVSRPVAAQNTWRPYEFNGTERFNYEVELTESGVLREGYLTLEITDEGGRTWVMVDAAVGDMSCSGRSPYSTIQSAQQAIMVQCLTMAPVMAALYTPTWGIFMGRTWELGSRWSRGSGDQGESFEVTDVCEYAGVEGLLAVINAAGNRIESCVATDVALPLAMYMDQEQFQVAIRLTEFRR